MRVLIVGMGVQGIKRKSFCNSDFVGFVDPINNKANWRDINDVPLDRYDAILACIPDKPKEELIRFCIKNNKHILVEKPLFMDKKKIEELIKDIHNSNIICYLAYNHRFEPHFVNLKNLITSNKLGKIYSCRMFYGNGTARLVKQSQWRDKGSGVLSDLGSHLLDTCNFWFGDNINNKKWQMVSCNNFENLAPDHAVIFNQSYSLRIELEMTMLMWKNHFTCDILAEKGSAHIVSLCKWGPSKFIIRKRILPSGIPKENQTILIQDDPTWKLEYEFFKNLIYKKKNIDLDWQIELNNILKRLSSKII